MTILSYSLEANAAPNQTDPWNILDLRKTMQRQAGRDASHAADENGEEIVQVVVLRDYHGKHQHLHVTVLILKCDVLDRVTLDVGLLVELATFLPIITRNCIPLPRPPSSSHTPRRSARKLPRARSPSLPA